MSWFVLLADFHPCVCLYPPAAFILLQDFRTAFCINCGANEDVQGIMESLGPNAQQFVRLVFIDSHRPIHHSLHNEDDHNCVLLHDPDCGDSPLDSIPFAVSTMANGTGALMNL